MGPNDFVLSIKNVHYTKDTFPLPVIRGAVRGRGAIVTRASLPTFFGANAPNSLFSGGWGIRNMLKRKWVNIGQKTFFPKCILE